MAHRPAASARAPARLRLRLLGELEVRRGDGVALPLPASRRTRALLGYLVAQAAPQSRSALCDLLWDGPDDPRAALRWSLTKLRAVVDDDGCERLQADRAKVAFDARDCEVDTAHVAALVGDGTSLGELPLDTLEAAAGALRGEFLDGLELPACYRFHHWCMAERERHARLRRGVLEALATRLAGDPQRALQHGRAMVAADPLAEAAHATLVRMLAAAGRYPEAEQHYGWARELLQREIAMPAGGPLDEAIRAVRRQQRQAAASASPASTDTHVAAPPAEPRAAAVPRTTAAAALVGRDDECRAIEAALAAPTQAPVLHLLGEPGIGKTRLLDHLAERAGARGFRVLRARCYEAEAVRPYGFWLDALRGVPLATVSEPLRDGVATLLGGGASAASREQLFDAAAAMLAELALVHPLALVVDDLQWIDDASVALLHYMARRLTDPPAPVLFAFAARAGEIDDNAGARRLLQSLARERTLHELALRPLDADDVQGWLGARLADVDAAMRDSGGNPLYLIELSRTADNGTSRAGRPLEALIGDRLHGLDDASRDLLGWAAAFGAEFDAARLAAATALPVAEVLARLAPVERRGLLHDTPNGGFDFAHGLVRQAIYRMQSTPRRRALHQQIAHALAIAAATDPWQHGAVVHHAGQAGDTLLAARAALAAGEHWLRVFANVEAAQVAERGLAWLVELPGSADRARLEVGLLRLRVAAAAAPGGRRLPALQAHIERAIDAAQAHGLHAEASAGWEILAFWRQQSGDAAGAHQATLAAERCTQRADAVTRCQQMANTGRCLIEIEADGARGRALLADAAALAAQLQLPVMELEWGHGLVARADGDREAAHAALSRAVALARAAGNHWREYECMLALATLEYELGQTDALREHVAEVAQAARRMGETQVPYADALAALSWLRRGDRESGAVDSPETPDAAVGPTEPAASAMLVAALTALRERDDKAHLAFVLNEAALLTLTAGDRVAAARHAAEALAAATALHRPSQIERAQATLAAAARPTVQAR